MQDNADVSEWIIWQSWCCSKKDVDNLWLSAAWKTSVRRGQARGCNLKESTIYRTWTFFPESFIWLSNGSAINFWLFCAHPENKSRTCFRRERLAKHFSAVWGGGNLHKAGRTQCRKTRDSNVFAPFKFLNVQSCYNLHLQIVLLYFYIKKSTKTDLEDTYTCTGVSMSLFCILHWVLLCQVVLLSLQHVVILFPHAFRAKMSNLVNHEESIWNNGQLI